MGSTKYIINKVDAIKKTNQDVEFTSTKIDDNFKQNLYLAYNNQKKSRFVFSFTKSRSDFDSGGAKPYKQKGTGRARQGTIRSPLKVGGSVIFGPKPRKVVRKTNKKFKSNVITQLLLAKIKNSFIINNHSEIKKAADFIKLVEPDNTYLFIININNEDDITLFSVIKNLPNLYFTSLNSISIEDILRVDKVIFSDTSFTSIFKKEKND